MTTNAAATGEGAGASADPAGFAQSGAPAPGIDPRREALRLAGLYAAFATLWILASDYLARHSARTPDDLLQFSVLKGLLFVGVTAAILFGLTVRLLDRLVASMHRTTLRDAEVARLSRLYAALGEVNHAILWSRSREVLFTEVCRALVEQGGLRTAWIGRETDDTRALVAVASHGDGSDLPVAATRVPPATPPGDGEAAEAFRRGRPAIRNHVQEDRRDDRREGGLAASAAFPIRDGSEVAAVLVVQTDVPGYFQDLEVGLLLRATSNLSYALDNFRREERRLSAEERAQAEREFAQTLLESMPGVIFLYDENRRIVRWNRQLERTSGYAARDIAGMHPHDFFQADGRERVDAAIDRIFAGEESNLTGRLQSADGGISCYQLVSRRVEMGGRAFVLGQGIELVPPAADAPAPADPRST